MKKNITLVPYKRVKLHVTGFKRRILSLCGLSVGIRQRSRNVIFGGYFFINKHIT